MTIVSNFTLIQGDENVSIGDAPDPSYWEQTFRTDGRLEDKPVILMLMVQGLTQAAEDVEVKLNGVVVGHISPYNGADPYHLSGNAKPP
jgi:hypothetical protein